MPKIDIDNYIEQSGMRKARFGGYEPEDVHQAMEDLCADYEQHLTAMTSELRTLRQENDALRRHAQGLVMQNQTLSTQNATLAGQVDKLQSYRANLETQFSTVKELTERCEEANSALRVKGRAHDQARQQVIADRDKVIADAEAEAARIRQQARDDADQILKDTNLKAEAIDQLAREQAIAQARKMVQSATDETREIQNAHRLRLQDLKSRISEMEKTRGEMMDYLAKMIEELQKTQEYASQNAPLVPHKEELAEADAEPRLDLSANKVDAAASALRGSEEAPAEEPPAPDANRVVAPGLDDEEPRTNTVVTPSPDYFDTTPNPQPGDAHEEVEIPGAIFSYPILRQQGEPILDEGTPPPPTPHRPLMPSITLADEDDEESGSVVPAPMTRPTAPAPQKTAKAQTKRRRKAIMALRALHRKIGD